MEIQGQDSTNIVLKHNTNTKTKFGRSNGFNTIEHTVSRCHILFQLNDPSIGGPKRVYFEVVGKNPIWVRRQDSDQVEVFRKDEFGELIAGDCFCISAKNPVWFSLKSVGNDDDQVVAGVSHVDPVKEFGFLLKEHEFNSYPKKMIRDVKDWNWFLEEPNKDNDGDGDEDDIVGKNSSANRREKRKKGKGDDNDDDWRGESEDDKEIVTKLRKVGRPKYSMRSKDCNKPSSGVRSGEGSSGRSSVKLDDEETEDESEDEDTLGGFIVGDEDEDLEEKNSTDDDEEEELVDDDDDEDE